VPAARPSDYDVTLRAAIERVVMSRTTIKIELAEGMASDDQSCDEQIECDAANNKRCHEVCRCT
jgi:hypothetical protein